MSERARHFARGMFAVLVFISMSNLFSQGSLVPPGPPAPVMKTLDQVEARTPLPPVGFDAATDLPLTISESGSYYMTQSITGVGSDTTEERLAGGVVIDANNVQLDLNGFSLTGSEIQPTQHGGAGIHIAAERMSVSILNGIVEGWGEAGISADGAVACQVRSVRLIMNGRNDDGVTSPGLVLGESGLIQDCMAYGNGSAGFEAGPGTSIERCTAQMNGGNGFTVEGSTLRDATATKNTGIGFSLQLGSTANRCSANENGGDGFTTSLSILTESTAYNNGGIGIVVGSGSLVERNNSRSNDSLGISVDEVSSGSRVADNVSSFNGGIGLFIRLNARGNRVEGNTLYANGNSGLRALGEGNLIVRNFARANGDTGNASDEFDIIDAAEGYGGLIRADTGSSFTTDRPWINFYTF